MDLQTLKNKYAQEQGYEDWSELWHAHIHKLLDFEIVMDEICIRAQKAALEKAAESAKVQHYNTRTEKKESASAMGNKGQVFSVDSTSITNPENLIL